ncbi:MAG: ATP-binding protein [Myxococcota bacterium]
MARDHDDLDLNPDGGLETLVDLRRPVMGTDTSLTGVPSVILEPHAFRLERMLRSDFRVHGVPMPFVGRRAELERLYNAVRDAVNARAPRTVGVIGEAGSGRTRLLAEMFSLLEPERRGFEISAATCAEGEAPDGVAVVGQLLRRRFGVGPHDREDVARERIREGVEALVEPRRAPTAARHLGYLAGVRGLGPATASGREVLDFQRQALRTLHSLLRYDAERAPQVVVVHRARHLTPRTLTLLEGALDALSGLPFVLVLVGDAPTPAPLSRGTHEHTEIRLEPLSRAETERLVRAVLARVREIPPGLVEDLVARSAGSPRLVEDNVRLLVQRGALKPGDDVWEVDRGVLSAQVDLAASPEAAARARIGALPEGLRHALGLAAVIGTTFWREGLLTLLRVHPGPAPRAYMPWFEDDTGAWLDATLKRAVAEGLLVARDASSLEDQREIAFRDRADQEILLEDMAPDLRASAHRLAAQWLASLPLRDPAAWQPVVAEHLEAGGRPERAAAWWLRSAAAAREDHAVERARSLYLRALGAVEPDRVDLLVPALRGLGEVLAATGELAESRRVFGALLEASEVAGDPPTGAWAWLMLGRTHRRMGDHRRARPCLRNAETMYRGLEDRAGMAAVLEEIARLAWAQGADGARDEALRWFAEALSLRRRVGDRAGMADSLIGVAEARLHMGHLRAAEEGFLESLSLRRAAGDRVGEARTLVGLGAVRRARGELDEAIAAWQDGLSLADEVGLRGLSATFLNRLGEALAETGRLDAAERAVSEAARIGDQLGDRRAVAEARRLRGAVGIARGDLEGALAEVDEAIRTFRTLGLRPALAEALRTRGEILGHQIYVDESGDDALGRKACESFDAAVALQEEAGDSLELRRTLESYGRVLAERGEKARARALLERAAREAP